MMIWRENWIRSKGGEIVKTAGTDTAGRTAEEKEVNPAGTGDTAEEKEVNPTDTGHTAEEKEADLAAARLQKKKKKKRAARRLFLLLLLVIVGGGLFSGYRYRKQQAALAEQEADVLELSDGEDLIYGKITSAVGNDITITVMKADEKSGASGTAASVPDSSKADWAETDETRNYEIPVGTDVTTQLGAVTTFSRLRAGDVIGIVTESGTDNILRIKIIE